MFDFLHRRAKPAVRDIPATGTAVKEEALLASLDLLLADNYLTVPPGDCPLSRKIRQLADHLDENAERNEECRAMLAGQHDHLTEIARNSADLIGIVNAMGVSQIEISCKAMSVENDAEMTTGNVDAVAAATEELAASSLEIARQVNGTSQIVNEATDKAEHAGATIRTMVTVVGEVRQILALISDVASQTNLLALNATIEAARAGDAGKGFAVVANEVKKLATQSASAAEKITNNLADLTDISSRALDAVSEVTRIIASVHEAELVMAAAIKQQGGATKEISENAQQAAGRTRDVSADIAEIAQASERGGEAAQQVADVANSIARRITELQEQMQ